MDTKSGGSVQMLLGMGGGQIQVDCHNIFRKRCSCPLPKAGGFDEKILPIKTRGFAPQTREGDENDEMADVSQAKPLFAQSTAFATPKLGAL